MRKTVFMVVFFIIFTVSYAETSFNGNIDIIDGVYNFEFKLFTSNTSKYYIWSEIHTDVLVNDGSYSVELGSINPLISIDPETMYYIEVYLNDSLAAERSKIELLSEIDGFARELELPDSSTGVILEEHTPSLEIGNGSDDAIVIDGSDFGIGLDPGTDATGRLEVRGDEVRVWDGSGSVGFANDEGDVYVEDQLEIDNTIYAAHYRDSEGNSLLNAGKGIEVSEDSDGSWRISSIPCHTWTFDMDLEGWVSNYHCYYTSHKWGWDSDSGNGTAFARDPRGITSQTLRSPVMNVVASSVSISYRHKYMTEVDCDHGYLAYRIDGGSWVQFFPTIGAYPGLRYMYHDPVFGGCGTYMTDAYYGSADYETHGGTISTSGASTIQFIFVFTTANSIGGTGWYIDDFSVCGIDDSYFKIDTDWTGAGSGRMTTADTLDNVGIGTWSVIGKLDVRGDEVRIWDGDASCDYADGSGDLYIEDVLEVDNSIYVPGIYDADNDSFNLDPSGTSVLNIINNGSYILNAGSNYDGAVAISDTLIPRSASYLGTNLNYWRSVYASKYIDSDNSNYFIDPDSTSVSEVIVCKEYLTNNGTNYGGNLAVNDNIIPTMNNYDLGAGADRDWNELWLSGMIYIDGSSGSYGQVLKTDGAGNVYWGEDITDSSYTWCVGDITFGASSGSNGLPWYGGNHYCRSAILILDSELPGCDGGVITAISVYARHPAPLTYNYIKIFMKETVETSYPSDGFEWSPGVPVNHTTDKQFNTMAWHTFSVNPPFDWNKQNLQISFEDYTSDDTSYPEFNRSEEAECKQVYGTNNYEFPVYSSNYHRTLYRPVIRLTFEPRGIFREREVVVGSPNIYVSSIDFDCGTIELLGEEVRVNYSEAFSAALGCRTPIVMTNALEPGKNIYISDVDQTGFTAHCDDTEGSKFNWSAMMSPNPVDSLSGIESSEEYIELGRELYENPSVHTYEEWNSLFINIGAERVPMSLDEYNRRVFSSTEDITGEE